MATKTYKCPTCNVSIPGRKAFCSAECRPGCAVDHCTRKISDRNGTLCRQHLTMRGPADKACRTCDTPISGHRTYCAESCRPACVTQGCERATSGSNATCNMHSQRRNRACPTCGEEKDGRQTYCSEGCRPECAFGSCKRQVHGKQIHCEAHWEQMKRDGEVKELAWAEEWICIVCGADVKKDSRRRRHCSNRCQALSSRLPDRPKSYDCVRCGVTVSLIEKSTRTGQFKRADSKFCKRCKWKTRTGVTVGEIAKRDGTVCKLCGDDVDMSADSKDPFRGSVDHIMPRALGGTNSPENLQLTHLWCNQVKSSRADFTFMPEKVAS